MHTNYLVREMTSEKQNLKDESSTWVTTARWILEFENYLVPSKLMNSTKNEWVVTNMVGGDLCFTQQDFFWGEAPMFRVNLKGGN